MKKRILACLMAVMATASFTSCGSSDNGSSTDSTGNSQTSSTESAASSGEVTMVDFHYINFGTLADTAPVNDVINAYLEEQGKDVRVNLLMYDAASYNDQMNLMISSGEPVDLFLPLAGVSSCVSKGQIYDITDMAEANCPGAMELTSDWLKAATVDGRLYGIPVYKGIMLQNYFIASQAMVDELGIDLSTLSSLEDLPAVFDQVKAAYPDVYPLVPLNANAYNLLDFFLGTTNGYRIDMLGDRTNTCTGCIVGDDMTVVNLYETDAFRECCELAYEWQAAGYLMPDTSTSPDAASSLMAAKRGFATVGGYGNSPEVLSSNSLGGGSEPAYYQLIESPYLTSTSVSLNYVVGITSEHPEAALRFLDLTYTDEFVTNSILYGVEGRDYKKVTDQTITYADGVDATTVAYDSITTCGILGSQFIQWGRDQDEEQLIADREFMQSNIENAVVSPAFGFVFDSSPVKTEVSSVSNVITQYFNALTNGELDPSVYIDEFNQKLKDAGLEAIIAEKQAQLDAWKESN